VVNFVPYFLDGYVFFGISKELDFARRRQFIVRDVPSVSFCLTHLAEVEPIGGVDRAAGGGN
jgi:hypothetical protein